MSYITELDLRRMSIRQLNHALLTDPANGHRYRPEINRRIAAGDAEAVSIYGNSRVFNPVTSETRNGAPPDIRDLWVDVRRDREPMTKLASMILNSGWDYSDPIHKMTMPPEAIDDFLKGLEWQKEQYFSEIPPEMQRILNMLNDVYGRWYRQQ